MIGWHGGHRSHLLLLGFTRSQNGTGYLTLVAADFDRLWAGVDAGDALGTAGAVLRFLGPSARQFIGRHQDFIFGWIGDDQTAYGRVLLLQIVPRPHLLAHRN